MHKTTGGDLMAKNNTGNLIGSWAFLIGVILAVVLGFLEMQQWMAILLVIIGIIVGLLNITASEAMGFLHASAVLVIVTALTTGGNTFAVLGEWAPRILDALLLVFVPATIIVSLRAVFSLAQS